MDGSPAPPSSPITAKANIESGSSGYVFAKRPGEALVRLHEGYSNYFKAGSMVIEGIESVTKSWVAAVSAFPGIGEIAQHTADLQSKFWLGPLKQAWQQCAEAYKNRADETLLNEYVHSPEYANGMIALGLALPEDYEVNQRLNYGFFTHNRADERDHVNGSLNMMDGEQILTHFKPGTDPDSWPNLILTSNHALVRDHKDVSGIMKGFHALIRDLFNGPGRDANRLQLLERIPEDDINGAGKKCIMLSSVHNHHNAWVNGGTLLRRLLYLDELYEDAQALEETNSKDEPEAQAWYERAYLGDPDDPRTWMSPASIRLAKLMLKLMVTEPNAVDIPGRAQFEEKWTIANGKDLTESYNTQPLTLRPDARNVLQHIKLVGYSKGGNIVTDALRYLTLDLQRVNELGKPLMSYTNEEDRVLPLSHSEDHDNLKQLMMNTGILAVNPGISPLTQREKNAGIRRLSVRNPEDWITAHLFARHDIDGIDGTNDDIFEVQPTKAPDNLGHSPEAAMGNMDKDLKGYLADGEKVQSDTAGFEEMRSRLKCFLASCHGQSGIKSMRTDEQSGAVYLEFSAGASEEDTKKIKSALEARLENATTPAVKGTKVTHDWRHSCDMIVQPPQGAGKGTWSDAKATEALNKAIGNALLDLEADDITFVGHNVYRDLGVDPPTACLGGR